MRREPVVFDVTNHKPVNFHNRGDDLFGFAKLQYTPSLNDVVNLEGNLSGTTFEVPFDSTGGIVQNDKQRELPGMQLPSRAVPERERTGPDIER